MEVKKKLVILGGGFAGIYTYLSIPKKIRKKLDITIVDKNNHFLFTPLLHEVATGALSYGSVVEPIRKLIDSFTTKFLQAEVVKVLIQDKKVVTSVEVLDYDYLVIALGATTNFFNIPGAEKYSFTLKSMVDSVTLRSRFIDIFEKASSVVDPEEKKKLLSFVVVGGGPTGVELAAECAELFYDTFSKYYKSVSCPDQVKIYLLNSGENLLKAFSTKFQKEAETVLSNKKVIVKNNVKVAEVFPDKVVTSSGEEIFASTVVWVAGVSASPVSFDTVISTTKSGRVEVNKFLQMENHNEIFVLGDIASGKDKDGHELPMLAQVAKKQGVATGRNISRIIKNQKVIPFAYRHQGNLVSIGQWHAVANIIGTHFTGTMAWFIWRTIYLFNFASWSKRFKIMVEWTINLFFPRDIADM